MPTIRPSRDDDLPAITAVYAHHVLHGTGTLETTPPGETNMAARRADVLSRGCPGWWPKMARCWASPYPDWFKPRPAYRFSAEDSIYLAPQAHGRGLGRELLTALAAQAEARGVRKLIAVIGDSANAGSVGVHRSCGFTPVGVLRSCGWKFGRWLDVVLMEKVLGAGDSTSPAAP